MSLEEIEKELKNLLGIPEEEKVIALVKYKDGKYYRIETYSPRKFQETRKSGEKKYHVPKDLEPQVLSLWKEYERLKKQEKEIKESIGELLRRFQNPDLIRKAVEELLEQGLRRKAKDFAYERFKNQALKLFEEFKPYLLELKKNEVKRISLLQALYLLANVRELFKEKGEEELKKALRQAILTIITRDKNQKLQNPFGVLKSDLFIDGKTEYDFLLSPFLESELSPILDKLLEAELEKAKTEEAMAQISEFVASLSDKAKTRVFKAFPSISEFTKALFRNWKGSGEDLKEFLKEWKDYLDMDLTEDEEIVKFLKTLI